MANSTLVCGEPAANWLMIVVAGGRTEKLCRGDSTLSAVRVLFCESKTAGWTELMDEPSGRQSSAVHSAHERSCTFCHRQNCMRADGKAPSGGQSSSVRRGQSCTFCHRQNCTRTGVKAPSGGQSFSVRRGQSCTFCHRQNSRMAPTRADGDLLASLQKANLERAEYQVKVVRPVFTARRAPSAWMF